MSDVWTKCPVCLTMFDPDHHQACPSCTFAVRHKATIERVREIGIASGSEAIVLIAELLAGTK